MAADELVEVHGDVLVVLARLDDGVAVLQQARQAQEHQERVAVPELGRWRQPTENIIMKKCNFLNSDVFILLTCSTL